MAGGVEAWNTSELLAACSGTTVKVWSPVSAEPRREVKINEGTEVHALDWSGNNKVLAVAGDKPQITMVGGGKVIGYVPEAIDASLSGVTAMRFSADSKKLAIGCANRTLHIRDLRSQGAGNKCLTDHRAAVCALAISPDDTILASSNAAGHVLLHEFKSGAKLGALAADGPIRTALQFSGLDGDLLAAAADDGGVAVWSVRARAPRFEMRRLHRGGATGVRFAPDSAHVLYSCGHDSRLLVLDTRQAPAQQEAAAMHAPQPLTCLDARFDARMLAAGTAAGGVVVYDLRRPGQPVNSLAFGDAAPVSCVRWQNAPHSSSKHKAAAAASAAAAPSASAGGQLGRLAAPAPSGAAAAVPGRGGTIPAARVGAAGGGQPARSPTPEVARGMSPELSGVSDLGLDGFPRAVSPVRLSDSGPDAHTPTGASVGGPPLLGGHTPADSFASGMAAFMVTPGVGVTRGLGAPGAAAADATPISRLAPFGGAAALPPGAAALPPAPAGAGARAALVNGTQRLNSSEAPPPLPPAGGSGGGVGGSDCGGAAAPKAAGPGGGGLRQGAPGASAPASAAATPRSRPGTSGSSGGGGGRTTAAAGGGGQGLGSRAASNAGGAALEAAAAAALDGGAAGARLGAAAAAAAAAAAGGLAGMALREDVFKGFIDQQMALVRQDVRNLHLEVLQQFHQAQMDLMSVVEGLAQRQEAISQRLEALGQQVQDMADGRGGGQGGGGGGISMAWL
ncbi:MAG: WD40-repeat-containing domain protein [Monoraphidium minutum]|nr:MAG: WD40-repeat-containing domain protein [Monoraphidium minutum]